MGTVGDALDNTVAESFFATLQAELLNRRQWDPDSREQLARAMFDYIECLYNPIRRRPTLGYLSPIQFEQHRTVEAAAA